MKSLSYRKCFLILIMAFSLNACMEEYNEIVPDLEGVPAGGVSDVRIVRVSNNTLELELKVFAVDHFGSFIQGLSTGNFSVSADVTDLEYRILRVEEEADEFIGPYSAGLLFDQSGSINSTDPSNDRIAAGVSFSKLMSGGDEAAIAAFSGGGFYQYPFELLEGFSTDENQLIPVVESLAGRANGGTPLYQAIYNLIPFVAAGGKNENKAIVAFTDGGDTDGGVTIDEMVNRACVEGVKIFTVGLGGGVDQAILSQIAFRTGGAVMLAEDALQLVSLYSSLGELLQGKGRFYNVRLEIVNPSQAWGPGYLIGGVLNLNLSEKYPVRLPFNTFLTRENAGSLDERVPDCSCTTTVDANAIVTKWQNKVKEYIASTPANPEVPNEAITCAYANIYYENPEKFKWAGLAAIVSGKIGKPDDCILNNVKWFDFFGFEEAVLEGNKAVFNDLFWQHLAFQEGGIEEIEKIYCAGQINAFPTIDLPAYRAWLKITQEDEDAVWDGNKDLLYHEQLNVLQSVIYTPFPNTWDAIDVAGCLISPVPGHSDEFPDGGNIDQFNQRWRWIETSILPAWRAFETNPNNESLLRTEHLKYCASCCR